MRYTECRLAGAAEELLLADLDQDTVDWGDNFDASEVGCVGVWVCGWGWMHGWVGWMRWNDVRMCWAYRHAHLRLHIRPPACSPCSQGSAPLYA
jgi:hypothetical protein